MNCCKDILSKMSDYFDRELDDENRKNLQSHFAGCAVCNMVMNSFKKTVELFSNSKPEKIPPDTSAILHARVDELRQKTIDDA
ncbi:MAG: anti-sigma factor family protein [Nitrospinota bacterium]